MRDPKSASRLLQMVDSETGEVACYNAWAFVVGRSIGGENGGNREGSEEKKDFVEEWPEDSYAEAIVALQAQGDRMREKWMGKRDHARMYICLCLPLLGASVFLDVRYAVDVKMRHIDHYI